MADLLEGSHPAQEPGEPGGPRRPVVLAGLIAAAVVAGGAWLARNTPDDAPGVAARRPAPATEEPATEAPVAGPGIATAETDPLAIAVSFADADHGYALAGRCLSGSGPCHYTFEATADGGRSWQARALPLASVTPPDGYSAEMRVIGPTSVLVDDRGWRWFSNDAGLSWQQPPAPTITPVPAVPPGTRVTGACPYAYESTAGCSRPVAVLDPRTGQRAPLANQPALRAVLGTERLPDPSDGSIWIPGIDPATGGAAVAVSRDRGRTWRTTTFPTRTTALFGVSVRTRDGVTAYAFVRGQVPAPAKNGLVAVWRTTDGGAQWRPVDPRAHPNTALGVALLPDGRLLITTETLEGSNAWYSDDGARTFRRAAGPGPLLGWIEEAGGRYTAGGISGGYYTSTDGRSWTPVQAAP